MKIPRFWARSEYTAANAQGKKFDFVAWGASDRSATEAREDADRRVRRAWQVVAVEGRNPRDYEYADRPIREEILERVTQDGAEIAMITRNRYGARVLNCSQVMFADVDLPPAKPVGCLEALRGMFGGGERQAAQREQAARAEAERVQAWVHANRGRGFRLYRTFAGLRLLFTDGLYTPNAPETTRTLEELRSDPLYIRLTQKQECFRARLTAKPYRCECSAPPRAFPWNGAEEERRFRKWLKEYEQADAAYRACEFLGQFGTEKRDPAIAKIVELHDRETRVASPLPLA
jgi:hypothetical protein